MLQAIPREIFYFAGLGVFILIGIVVVEVVKNLVDGWWKKKSGNRRKRDDDWTDRLIGILGDNGRELGVMSADIKEIKLALKNGLSDKLGDIKMVMQKCHELNIIKEHDIKTDRED